MRIDWHKFIMVDPEIHHGEPCMAGTRIPVSTIIQSREDGMTVDEILSAYPQLSREAVEAVLAYRSEVAWERLIEIGRKMGKGSKNKKSAVEILSEMRR
ncbi:MAG: DUF433 domain-containing protein [Anaerolineales bacterium]|nr:DUF433 domain-containing protein [Anaerolineales bacterium]